MNLVGRISPARSLARSTGRRRSLEPGWAGAAMPLLARTLLPLLPCLASAYALHLPVIRPRVAEAKVDRRPHLIAQASELPAPTTADSIIAGTSSGAVQLASTTTGSVVAGIYSGVMQFTFATACASIIFVPVGLPISIGIQHCLIGFVIMQAVVAKTTSVKEGVVLLSPSFEVLPFLAKFAMIVAGSVGTSAAPGVVLATVLAGSILCKIELFALLHFVAFDEEIVEPDYGYG